MNLFVLHQRHKENAMYHVDRHVVKMPIEATQMLCTVLRERCGIDYGYKSTYVNHPVTQWVGASIDNFIWTYQYATLLFAEYTHRYGKVHKSQAVLEPIANFIAYKQSVKDLGLGLTPFHLAVSPELKHLEPVDAYRAYYLKTKKRLFKWTNREVPYWIDDPPYQLRDYLR